jgi:hypothetical protein
MQMHLVIPPTDAKISKKRRNNSCKPATALKTARAQNGQKLQKARASKGKNFKRKEIQ